MNQQSRMWLRVLVDYGALAAFLGTLLITHDLIKATGVLVAASIVVLLLGWLIERRVAPLPLIYGAFAVVFGSLTLIFHDKSFVKMKLTFVDTGLAVALIVGMMLKRNPLKVLFNDAIKLPDPAWRVLTIRYAVFFLACAIANEIVWRTQSDERWGIFRGVLVGVVLIFSIAQTPFLLKHMEQPVKDGVTPEPPDTGL